ncbi:enoyl-CoA hydratase/isomerase family protein [Nocardioides immobilis]|uniref:Enoyl-CoA hydratase/isomerase family protein n=1 Tax=Nocardioides immobilis TaxID=2049295 RepID=A0A417Y8Q6_9ACTN|nr:enoyl-CoA hydratase/isomerase family protein [Nocardioides immobilis]
MSAVSWSSPSVAAAVAALTERSIVTVGWSSTELPPSAATLLRALTLTLAPAAPERSWVDGADQLEAIAAVVTAAPGAALTLTSLLPASERIGVYDALQLESLAYSTLLAGPEFAAWRARTPRHAVPPAEEPVLLARDGDQLNVTLNRPARHNAFGRAARDGLIEALDLALLDRSIESVVLKGAGPSFCSGGDLDEFGTAADPVDAHLVRLARSAGWRVHQLRGRLSVRLHGACIGAGVEVPSFAGRVEARPDTWFLLPELSMGLVPGAGGTVSLPRRIGRWRTAYLALSGVRLDAATAHEWGLVDAIV